jgi:hypothetical protein
MPGALTGSPFIAGSGFASGAPAAKIRLAARTARDRHDRPTGSFTTSVQIPSQTMPGEHELYAVGKGSSGKTRLLARKIIAIGKPALTKLGSTVVKETTAFPESKSQRPAVEAAQRSCSLRGCDRWLPG